MPAVGDQHRSGPVDMSGSRGAAAMANPYEESQAKRMSEYTVQQIATLQNRLDKRLGPEYLSTRQGPGGQRVHYISADKCISLANEVFGFNGWSSSIQNIQVDFVDEEKQSGKISLGLSVIMRVTLKDGTFHEDIGYGHIENCKGKAPAFEKAKKEGTTDALKRTLRTFGNVLGNCLYDKEYLSRVTKVKAIPTKWDVDELHRHSDFAPAKKEPAPPTTTSGNGQSKSANRPPSPLPAPPQEAAIPVEFEGEFGSDLFDEADFGDQHTMHPDEVVLDPQPQNNVGYGGAQSNLSESAKRAPNGLETPSKPQRTEAAQPVGLPPPANNVRPNVPSANQLSTPSSRPPQSRPQPAQQNNAKPIQGKPGQPAATSTNLPPHSNDQTAAKTDTTTSDKDHEEFGSSNPSNSQIPEDKRPQDPQGGFYSGRAAEALKSNPYDASKSAPTFDPHFDSPSIRKTAGFNHNMSAPVARGTYQVLPPQGPKNRQHPPNPNDLPPGARSPSVSNAQDASRKPAGATTAAPTANRGNTPLPKIEPVATFAGPGRSPMTTSYRPPTRRSMAEANGNTNQASNTSAQAPQPQHPPTTTSAAQNTNGKRPPLSDATNTSHAVGPEKGNDADTVKRAKVGDGGGGASGPGQAVPQGQ